MANLQTISSRVFGDFRPTGIYSFEMRVAKQFIIYELPFLLPPETLQMSEPWLADETETAGGGYISDWGNGFKDITVSGQCYFFYAGKPGSPGATDVGNSLATSTVDGYSEFLKLRFMASRYRDYQRFDPRSKVRAPHFTLPDLALVEAFRVELEKILAQSRGGLSDQIQLYWHAYDFDDHWAVTVESFDWRITKDDPFTVYFDIKMKGYEQDSLRSGVVLTRGGTPVQKPGYTQKIKNVQELLASASEASQPIEATVSLPQGQVPYPSQVA